MDFIHRFIPGRRPLTVLLLHGSGGDENDLIPIGSGLAPGAALLSPLGKVVQHGARRFFSYPGPDGFDAAEVRQRVDELADWLAQMPVDPKTLYALGYSNGANMAAALMLLRPGSIAGACLLRVRAAVIPDPLPDLHGQPVLISAGQTDPIIPAAGAEHLAKLLTEAGAQVDFAIQNADHDLTPADFSLAKQWFAKLRSSPPADSLPDPA